MGQPVYDDKTGQWVDSDTGTPVDNPFGFGGANGGGGNRRYTQTNKDGSKTIYEIDKDGNAKEIGTIPPPKAPTDALVQDLRDLGLVPIDEYANQPETAYRESQALAVGRDPSTALTPEQFAQNVKGGTSSWLIDPTTGLLYDRKGKLAPEWLQKSGVNGTGGAMTEYQRAALAESQRQNRIAEVQAAQNAIEQRIQNAQQARLEGAKMAITPDMAASGYFPSLGPNSPIVRAGLADPMRFTPIPFSADQGLNINQDQVARDLAMVRSLAGYGG